MRSAHSSTQTPAQTSAFLSSTSTVDRSANLPSPLGQPLNPFNMPSKPITQTLTAPIQPASAGAPHAAMAQTQPLSHALNDPSRCTGIPAAPPGANTATDRRPEAAPANQSASDVYPHQINGIGGPTATAPFLQDFNLVAEAAKRAQMAVVMRDLESVTL